MINSPVRFFCHLDRDRLLVMQLKYVCLANHRAMMPPFMPYMYGLLTKCEVKMAGYWPSSFFASLCTETKSRSINSQKKNESNIQPS